MNKLFKIVKLKGKNMTWHYSELMMQLKYG